MKLAIRGLCVAAIALTLVGLALYLSAASLSGASALAREDLASGLVNGGSKLAVLVALIAAFLAGQRAQWSWVTALGAATVVTLFAGTLGALTHTGALLDFLGPIVAALLAAAYSVRTPNLTPVRVG